MPPVRSSQRLQNKENLELSGAEAKENCPPQRVTRSRAAASSRCSKVVPDTPPAPQAAGEDPCVEADRVGAAELLPTSPGNGSPEEHGAPKSPPVPTTPELEVPCTPEAEPEPKAANVTVILSPAAGLEQEEGSPQEHSRAQEPSQPPRNSPGTPRGARLSRRSVRRSLMGKPSLSSRTSLAEKYSLASKRESMIRTSTARTVGKKKGARKGSVSCSSVEGEIGCCEGVLLLGKAKCWGWVFGVGVEIELLGLDRLQSLMEALPGFLEPSVSRETQVTDTRGISLSVSISV